MAALHKFTVKKDDNAFCLFALFYFYCECAQMKGNTFAEKVFFICFMSVSIAPEPAAHVYSSDSNLHRSLFIIKIKKSTKHIKGYTGQFK